MKTESLFIAYRNGREEAEAGAPRRTFPKEADPLLVAQHHRGYDEARAAMTIPPGTKPNTSPGKACEVPECNRPANHSQLHNVIAALLEACDELETEGVGETAKRLRVVARNAIESGRQR